MEHTACDATCAVPLSNHCACHPAVEPTPRPIVYDCACLQTQLVTDNPYRPMDLRAAQRPCSKNDSRVHALVEDASDVVCGDWRPLLQAGSAIAAEARAALKVKLSHSKS